MTAEKEEIELVGGPLDGFKFMDRPPHKLAEVFTTQSKTDADEMWTRAKPTQNISGVLSSGCRIVSYIAGDNRKYHFYREG